MARSLYGATLTDRVSTWTRRVAAAGLALFSVAVASEHVLNPDLSPWRHQISEYAMGSDGWPMDLGFAAWAFSLSLTAALLRFARARLSSRAVAVAALGAALLAAFETDTVAGDLPPHSGRTEEGRIHDLGGELVTATLLASALVVASDSRWTRKLRHTAIGIILYFVTVTAGLLVFTSDTGGLRQRLLLIAAVGWHAALLATARRGRIPHGRTGLGSPSDARAPG